MSQEFQAIYENGILRLVQPLDLPENSPVYGVVENAVHRVPEKAIQEQQQALDAMRDTLSALPQN